LQVMAGNLALRRRKNGGFGKGRSMVRNRLEVYDPKGSAFRPI
jgi:hypothetical protein